MKHITQGNYVTIEGLIQRITSRQNIILEKYSTNSKYILMELITPNDLKEWQELQLSLNRLTPILNNLKEYD